MTPRDQIITPLKAYKGQVSFYAKNLVTQEVLAWNEDLPLIAASIIKIPVLIECFAQMESGKLKKDSRIRIGEQDKMPSCGALTYMHTGLEVSVEDLYTLMIILSDNTATNLLIDLLGMEHINQRLELLGCQKTRLNRRLFDDRASSQGVENYITAKEIGLLLEKLERREVVSRTSSDEMLRILCNQRLNGKIPVLLPSGIKIAHKTGEDTGITHDVGIIYGPDPFVFCLCANEVDRGLFEREIQTIAKTVYDAWETERSEM